MPTRSVDAHGRNLSNILPGIISTIQALAFLIYMKRHLHLYKCLYTLIEQCSHRKKMWACGKSQASVSE